MIKTRSAMSIEELKSRLDTLLKGFPASGFDAVADSTVAELETIHNESENLGMKSGQKLISNLLESLKTRKSGGNSDDSVKVRLVALDFYVKNLQNGSTEEL